MRRDATSGTSYGTVRAVVWLSIRLSHCSGSPANAPVSVAMSIQCHSSCALLCPSLLPSFWEEIWVYFIFCCWRWNCSCSAFIIFLICAYYLQVILKSGSRQNIPCLTFRNCPWGQVVLVSGVSFVANQYRIASLQPFTSYPSDYINKIRKILRMVVKLL